MCQHGFIHDIRPDEQATVAVALVNTWDEWFTQPEKLTDVVALDRFLGAHDAPDGLHTDEDTLVAVRALRADLRPVFGPSGADARARFVGDVLSVVSVRPTLVPDGTAPGGFRVAYRLPADVGAEGWLRAVTGLGTASALTRWGVERLRSCEAAPCVDVFVDSSRNGRRRFCCLLCQNRVNAAAHRARRAAHDGAA